MTVSIENDKIRFKSPYSLDTIGKAKHIGMRWNKKDRLWEFGDNLVNRQSFRLTFPDAGGSELVNRAALPSASQFLEPQAFLMEHQKYGYRQIQNRNRHLFAWDTGTGKTLLGLMAHQIIGGKTLVVCPLSIVDAAWRRDAQTFVPDCKVLNLWKLWQQHRNKRKATRGQLIERAIKANEIIVVNFETFKIVKGYLDGKFKTIIIDESSKIKNPKSKITKALIEFAKSVEHAYEFSGTPAPNGHLEYFPQVALLDPTVFGASYYRFREQYFSSDPMGFKWSLRPEMKQVFMEQLGKVMSVVRKHDVLDLPERTDNVRDVILSAPEQKAYKQMHDELIIEIEGEAISAYNAAVKLMKLRQVTSGFILGESGPIFIGGNKLKELTNLLEEIGDHPVIIWTQFHAEADQICELLKYNVNKIDGRTPPGARDDLLEEFKTGVVQYLVAHPRTIGHGVTLVNCQYQVYYSLSFSHEEHSQSRDRIYRKGQDKPCTYYYLISPGTIDSYMFKVLTGKATKEAAVMEYIKNQKLFEED